MKNKLPRLRLFKLYPEKQLCIRRKSFTSVSLESGRRGRNAPPVYLRSQDSYLHIPQIYCNTLLSTNSTASVPTGAGVSWTHTYTH